MKILASFFFLFSLTTGLPCIAQDFATALKELQASYANLERVHTSMTIQIFETESSSKPLMTSRVEVKRDHDNYRYTDGATEMVMNSKYVIMADRDAQEIYCDPRNLNDQNELEEPMMVNLDSLLKFQRNTKYVKTSGDVDQYTLQHSPNDALSRTSFFIDRNTKLITRIEYCHKDGQRVSIQFTKFNTSPVFSSDTFDEAAFVVSKGKTFSPAARFAGFKVIATKGS
jgi:outer membrane lipoprotein-sorting protein